MPFDLIFEDEDAKRMLQDKIGFFTKGGMVKIIQRNGELMFEDIQNATPVRTGTLKGSEEYKATSDGFQVSVGNEKAYYWGFVEYGTSRMRARPYIRPAVLRWLPAIISFVKKAFEEE